MSDDALRIDFQRGAKFEARFFQFSGFVENATEIDVRFAPQRLHVDNAAVKAHSLFRAVGLRFTAHRVFENLFRGAGLHLANFLGAPRAVKWKYELSGERLDSLSSGAWGDGGDLPAAGEKLQCAQRRVNFFAPEFERGDRAANFSRRDAAFGDAFYRSQRNQIAKIIKTLTPACAGNHQAKTLPIAQTRCINAYDAADFPLRESFWQ